MKGQIPCKKILLLKGRYKNDKRAQRKPLSEGPEKRIHNLFNWLENGIESGLISKKEWLTKFDPGDIKKYIIFGRLDKIYRLCST